MCVGRDVYVRREGGCKITPHGLTTDSRGQFAGIGDMDSAEQSFRSHLETVIEQAIVLALKGGKDGKTASLFPPELGGLKPRFQPDDLAWAKQLARKLPAEQSNSWLRLISRHEDEIKLAVSAQDYSQAKAKFDIHMKRKDYKSAREVVEQESHLATKKHTLGLFVASKYLSERDLLEDLITRLNQNTEDSAEASLDNMLDTLGQHWLKRDHHKVCLELHADVELSGRTWLHACHFG